MYVYENIIFELYFNLKAVQRHYADVYQAVQRAERDSGMKSPIADEIDITR